VNNIQIRKTTPEDRALIWKVEKSAFGQEDEARLTEKLLADPTADPSLSLLAIHNREAIGHILFTRVYLNSRDPGNLRSPGNSRSPRPLLHILAPMAVIPEFQRRGIGGMLIKEGLMLLREMGSALVFVLGHMEYYPRYGFQPDAAKMGFTAPYPIPEEFANAWMLQYLNSSFEGSGNILCAKELDKPELWRE